MINKTTLILFYFIFFNNNNKTLKRILYTFLSFIGGLAFILLGVLYYMDTMGYTIEGAEETTGIISGWKKSKNDNSMLPNFEYTVFNPRVKFTTKDGRKIEFLDLVSESDKVYPVGSVVDVVYNPMQPGDARLIRPKSIWGQHLILIGLGAVLLGISIIIFRFS